MEEARRALAAPRLVWSGLVWPSLVWMPRAPSEHGRTPWEAPPGLSVRGRQGLLAHACPHAASSTNSLELVGACPGACPQRPRNPWSLSISKKKSNIPLILFYQGDPQAPRIPWALWTSSRTSSSKLQQICGRDHTCSETLPKPKSYPGPQRPTAATPRLPAPLRQPAAKTNQQQKPTRSRNQPAAKNNQQQKPTSSKANTTQQQKPSSSTPPPRKYPSSWRGVGAASSCGTSSGLVWSGLV